MGDLSYRVRGSYFESCNCTPHGECVGVRSWAIESGHVDGIEIGGLDVALVYRYDEEEDGSPWSVVLHVDEDGDRRQRAALKWLFLDGLHQFPWIRKARHLIAVRESAIEIEGTSLRIGERVAVSADELRVDDEPFSWALQGTRASASDFNYASA